MDENGTMELSFFWPVGIGDSGTAEILAIKECYRLQIIWLILNVPVVVLVEGVSWNVIAWDSREALDQGTFSPYIRRSNSP